MRRDERPATLDNCFPVGLEGVGRVVEPDAKKDPYEEIGHAIQHQLKPWIVNRSAAGHEATSKHAFPSLVQHLPVAHDVAAVVAFVGHHDDHCVAGHLVRDLG